jgi:Lon protease-like protein
MVRDAVEGAGRIAMIQPHRLDDDNRAPLYEVGCVGELVSLEELEDGRFNIVLVGSNRFRLVKEEEELDAAYRSAEVDITAFDDEEPPPLSLGQRAEVEGEARRLGDAMGLAVDWSAVNRLDDEMLVNAISQVAPFDVGAKQALLEQPTLAGRADLLVQLMQFQRAAVTGGSEVEPTIQ